MTGDPHLVQRSSLQACGLRTRKFATDVSPFPFKVELIRTVRQFEHDLDIWSRCAGRYPYFHEDRTYLPHSVKSKMWITVF